MTFLNPDVDYGNIPPAYRDLAAARDRVLRTLVNDSFVMSTKGPVDSTSKMILVVVLSRDDGPYPAIATVIADHRDNSITTTIKQTVVRR